MNRKSVNPPRYVEVERYLNSVESSAENVLYWRNQAHECPLLSSVALDYLMIPASSAPVERVFSTAGESTTGKLEKIMDLLIPSNLQRGPFEKEQTLCDECE